MPETTEIQNKTSMVWMPFKNKTKQKKQIY